MASQTTVLLSLAALVCLAALALAAPQRFDNNDDMVNVFRERRTAQGRMRGYAGINMRRGYPMAFAGGYAASHNSPAFAAPAKSAEDEEEAQPEPQPIEASDEEEQQDEEEQTPAPVVKPVRPSRARPSAAKPSRPARPQKPQQEEEEEEDDVPAPPKRGNKQRGGATAIATSYSNGKGASSNSHAIAYDGDFSGGQFRHRYQ